jgi:hypothetical protein
MTDTSPSAPSDAGQVIPADIRAALSNDIDEDANRAAGRRRFAGKRRDDDRVGAG